MERFFILKFIFSIFLFFLGFIISFDLSAKLITLDIVNGGVQKYGVKEACEKDGFKNIILAEVDSTFQIDCMGTKVIANDFCLRHKYGEGKILRGYVDKENKLLICQKGTDVSISISCEGKDLAYCTDKVISCNKLNSIYALELTLLRRYVIEGDNGKKYLNCHFSK